MTIVMTQNCRASRSQFHFLLWTDMKNHWRLQLVAWTSGPVTAAQWSEIAATFVAAVPLSQAGSHKSQWMIGPAMPFPGQTVSTGMSHAREGCREAA
jgi:hypothetical protein